MLDVGCGEMPYKSDISCEEYIGTDVEFYKMEERANFVPFDGMNIPFENEAFDLVICMDVLEHATDAEYLIREMNRVLKKDNGYLYISMPFIFGEHGIPPYDYRRFTSFGIKQIAENNGFEIFHHYKEIEGIEAFSRLGRSEINRFAIDGQQIKHRLANAVIKISCGILKLLGMEMPGIFASNQIMLKKKS